MTYPQQIVIFALVIIQLIIGLSYHHLSEYVIHIGKIEGGPQDIILIFTIFSIIHCYRFQYVRYLVFDFDLYSFLAVICARHDLVIGWAECVPHTPCRLTRVIEWVIRLSAGVTHLFLSLQTWYILEACVGAHPLCMDLSTVTGALQGKSLCFYHAFDKVCLVRFNSSKCDRPRLVVSFCLELISKPRKKTLIRFPWHRPSINIALDWTER